MKQFGIVAIFLEDVYRADGREFDDLEAEIAVEGVCTPDRQHHDAAAPEIALVECEAGRGDPVRPLSGRLFPDEAPGAVAVFPRRELLFEARRRPRRAVGIANE